MNPGMCYDVATSVSGQMDEEKCGSDQDQKVTLVYASASPGSRDDDERKSLSVQLQGHHARKKVKVDWTPELHGKFVKAVEQIGLDKAVPSKILELMGTDCLTRHNVASHLQKYRTHQKNLMAREAEVATLRQRRRVYGTTTGSATSAANMDANSWGVPTTGFPPVRSAPCFSPHVWGYPSSISQPWSYTWPNHQAYSPNPPHVWAPHQSSWYSYHQGMAPGVPCYPHPSTMFATPGIGIPVVSPSGKTLPQPPSDSYLQSIESIDAVIADVLSKPWLPMPLGLKPPSIDSILVELQHQGISKIPTPCAL